MTKEKEEAHTPLLSFTIEFSKLVSRVQIYESIDLLIDLLLFILKCFLLK
jgi:hypothetical protein